MALDRNVQRVVIDELSNESSLRAVVADLDEVGALAINGAALVERALEVRLPVVAAVVVVAVGEECFCPWERCGQGGPVDDDVGTVETAGRIEPGLVEANRRIPRNCCLVAVVDIEYRADRSGITEHLLGDGELVKVRGAVVRRVDGEVRQRLRLFDVARSVPVPSGAVKILCLEHCCVSVALSGFSHTEATDELDAICSHDRFGDQLINLVPKQACERFDLRQRSRRHHFGVDLSSRDLNYLEFAWSRLNVDSPCSIGMVVDVDEADLKGELALNSAVSGCNRDERVERCVDGVQIDIEDANDRC